MNKKRAITTCLMIMTAISTFSVYSLIADEKKEKAIKSIVSKNEKDEKVYELRTYTTPEGKLPKLHERFRDHTMKLFAKHGMKNVIYFTPVDKPNTLTYLLEHKSKKAAKASWNGFLNDPDWKTAYKKSIADGKLVIDIDKVFLKTTDYSPEK